MKKIHDNNQYTALLEKLSIDCKNCSGLCCVALYCAKAEGFPADKIAGKPCKNLLPDFRCAVHEKLMDCKLKGCMAYDCYGAGQKVTKSIYSGVNWQTNHTIKEEMFQVFLIVNKLHQMLWFLVEASTLIPAKELKDEINALIDENEKMTQLPPSDIISLNLDAYKVRVNYILKKSSELVQRATANTIDNIKSSDYIGKNFKKSNLNGQDFSMTLLIASNFEGCSLFGTNFLGADMRDANIKNADLSESIFLTQMQVNASKGNINTKLPVNLSIPSSWQK